VAADFISRRALAPVFDGNQKSAARLKALEPVLDEIKTHLGKIDVDEVIIANVCNLYSAYADAAAKCKKHLIQPLLGLRSKLVESCSSPNDFSSVVAMIDDNDKAEHESLRERFFDKCRTFVESEVDSADTSDQAQQAIDEFVDTVGYLGLDPTDLEITYLEEQVGKLSYHEERKAELDEDERHFERLHDGVESREIDDILDSMRE